MYIRITRSFSAVVVLASHLLLGCDFDRQARAGETLATASSAGVFIRFQLVEPAATMFWVQLGGYIHVENRYLPTAVIPMGADKDAGRRLKAGQFTDWFDLKSHAGKSLHGRLRRSGGVAEFPNVTANFVTEPKAERIAVVIELATAPDERQIVKRFTEQLQGSLTSFLVSPRLRDDADSLETAAQMTKTPFGMGARGQLRSARGAATTDRADQPAERGTALVLANFTYEPIKSLEVRLPLPKVVQSVRSVSHGPLKFTLEKADATDAAAGRPHEVRVQLDNGLTDIVLCE